MLEVGRRHKVSARNSPSGAELANSKWDWQNLTGTCQMCVVCEKHLCQMCVVCEKHLCQLCVVCENRNLRLRLYICIYIYIVYSIPNVMITEFISLGVHDA